MCAERFEKWKNAFKEIHRKSPTKEEYQLLAPAHVKNYILQPEDKENQKPKKGIPFVRLKRTPSADLTIRVPKSSKRRKGNCGNIVQEVSTGVRQLVPSPVKVDSFSDVDIGQCLRRSPGKQTSSPQKSISFRSPRKPMLFCKSSVCRNVGNLLLFKEEDWTSKGEEKETVNEWTTWEDEVSAKSDEAIGSVPSEEASECVDVQNEIGAKLTAKEDKKNMKKTAKKKRYAKPKGNFIRLNMKKKTFVRGHISAWSKRKKMRREKYKTR